MTPPRRYEVPPHALFSPCKGCARMVTIITTVLGRRLPVEADGSPHGVRCTGSRKIRDREKGAAVRAELVAEAKAKGPVR